MPVKLTHYGFTYALQNTPSLYDINLTIYPGEILLIGGASGSGKSTLLRGLKKAVTPAGTQTGSVNGLPADTEIAIVFQNPETQLVTATVINDLVFQMENRGMDPLTMKKRVSETVGFFGLEDILHKPTETLSGGQKQMTALCAALMCEPKLLLLDEPISQLDPLAGAAFLEMIRKINTELGITVVMAEHRLDECVSMADRVAFMENGRLLFTGAADATLKFLFNGKHIDYVPELPKASLHIDGKVALTPREFQAQYAGAPNKRPDALPKILPPVEILAARAHGSAVYLNDVTVSYPGAEQPVLNRLNLTVARGEILCLLGGNGSGKTTLLKLMAGIIKPLMGRVRTEAWPIGYMPQHVRDYFLHDRVADDWVAPEDAWTKSLAERLGVTGLLHKHPFDLSGGEQQKAALGAILSRKPALIMLDEPTKGVDPAAKHLLAQILRETGAAVIIATHDLEFAARWADRCAMLFDGEIAYTCSPRAFFAGNKYYTTAIHKGLRHINESAVVLQDVFTLWNIPSSD